MAWAVTQPHSPWEKNPWTQDKVSSGSRARKVVWRSVCVLCHALCHTLCVGASSLSPRTFSKAKHAIRSAQVISQLFWSHFPSGSQLHLEEEKLNLLQVLLISLILHFYSGLQAEFLGPQTVSCLLLQISLWLSFLGFPLEHASLFSRLG